MLRLLLLLLLCLGAAAAVCFGVIGSLWLGSHGHGYISPALFGTILLFLPMATVVFLSQEKK